LFHFYALLDFFIHRKEKMTPKSAFVMSLIAVSIGPLQAATTTTTFSVTATVLTSCLVVATPLAFGSYDPAVVAPLDATNTVTVTCTIGTPYNIGLNAGGGTGADVASRKMTSGVNLLNYTLYQETGRTTVWGNTVLTDTVNATALITPTVHSVYGRVFSGQYIPAGIYTDTISVTVTY
jgi:spore coat protein U-like protein